jgi:hypothetical protein
MAIFKPIIDFVTLGSERPLQRLTAYYVVLALAVFGLAQIPALVALVVPAASGDVLAQSSQILQDGLATGTLQTTPGPQFIPGLTFALSTTLLFMATLVLMLPVTWVYMSDRKARAHDQSMVETLIVLPIVVAGTVLVVRNSLALAFSLAGVVAAVRFRTSLSDTRDVVFIFLAIAVGFAAGVEILTVAAITSVLFNYLLLLSWRYDFGRNALQPTAVANWKDPLEDLATMDGDGKEVPDRDLVMALTPTKVDVLAKKFNRIKAILGDNGKKPRFNAIVAITTKEIKDAQKSVESVLDDLTKRWTLDEIVSQKGRASQIFYLVRVRKSGSRDELLTELRQRANGAIETAEVEVGDALSVENGQIRDARKRAEQTQG